MGFKFLLVSLLISSGVVSAEIGVSLSKTCDRELEDSRVHGVHTTCIAGKDDACPSSATKRITPVYPAAALKKGVKACVYMMYDVLPSGLADNFRVMKLAPNKPEFSKSVIDALFKWEFSKKPVKNQKIVVSFDGVAKPTIHEQKL
jgi:hypothetical protein